MAKTPKKKSPPPPTFDPTKIYYPEVSKDLGNWSPRLVTIFTHRGWRHLFLEEMHKMHAINARHYKYKYRRFPSTSSINLHFLSDESNASEAVSNVVNRLATNTPDMPRYCPICIVLYQAYPLQHVDPSALFDLYTHSPNDGSSDPDDFGHYQCYQQLRWNPSNEISPATASFSVEGSFIYSGILPRMTGFHIEGLRSNFKALAALTQFENDLELDRSTSPNDTRRLLPIHPFRLPLGWGKSNKEAGPVDPTFEDFTPAPPTFSLRTNIAPPPEPTPRPRPRPMSGVFSRPLRINVDDSNSYAAQFVAESNEAPTSVEAQMPASPPESRPAPLTQEAQDAMRAVLTEDAAFRERMRNTRFVNEPPPTPSEANVPTVPPVQEQPQSGNARPTSDSPWEFLYVTESSTHPTRQEPRPS